MRRKAIIDLNRMLHVVTSRQRLDTQNVIQMKTFITRNLGWFFLGWWKKVVKKRESNR